MLGNELESGSRPMFSTETALLEATNEWVWNIDNSPLKWCDIPGLEKKLLIRWIMLSNWESLNSIWSVLNLLTCSNPIYLIESSKRSLMEF